MAHVNHLGENLGPYKKINSAVFMSCLKQLMQNIATDHFFCCIIIISSDTLLSNHSLELGTDGFIQLSFTLSKPIKINATKLVMLINFNESTLMDPEYITMLIFFF